MVTSDNIIPSLATPLEPLSRPVVTTLTMTKTELRERANKAAKRLADARKVKRPPTPKRIAHYQKLKELNTGKKRSDKTKEKMRQARTKPIV
jgi:hypothetical protein